MKIKAIFILILIFSLLLVGCKQQPVEATVPPVTTVPTEPPAPKAGLLLRRQTADEADAQDLQQALEQLGYEVFVKDGENDQSKQNEQVKTLLAAGCEMLVVQPVMISGLDVLVEQVKPSGVPLIILDHQPEQAVLDLYDKLVFLGADHSQAGTRLSEIPDQLPVKGDLNFDGITSVVLICGPEDHLDSARRAEEFLKAMHPEIHVVLETMSADWTQGGGRTAAAQLLAKHGPDIEIMVTLDGNMALGALEAIDNGGWTPGQDLYLLTVGSSTTVSAEAEAGRISGLSCPDKDARLDKLSQLVTALAADQETEKINLIDYTDLVTIMT